MSLNNQNKLLHIAVALHCEAKLLISHFKLKKLTECNSFPVFIDKTKSIYLIITGIGKIKTASAITFLNFLTGNQNHGCFLNVGIAGSSQFNIGQAVLVNKIIEQSTQRCWYPFVTPLKNKNHTQLITHDLPQQAYPSTGMVDMEGSAFFQTSAHFVTQEQIQILKIISDDSVLSQNRIDPIFVHELMSKNKDEIDTLANYLISLSNQEARIEFQSEWLLPFQSQWHFTHSQSLQLKDCLRRWNLLNSHINPFLLCQNEKHAAQVLCLLKNKLRIT